LLVDIFDSPDVVAVIPTIGKYPHRLLACVEALKASIFNGRLAIAVVWNDPRQPIQSIENVDFFEPGLNLGFPGALNYARGHIQSEALWVLQDDVRVHCDCLEYLFTRIRQSSTVALVSPIAVNASGMIPAYSRAGVLTREGNMAHWYPLQDTHPEDLDLNFPLDWVSTSGALVRLTSWDAAGGYDPDFYPLQWSDVDFTYRLKKAGFEIVLDAQARINHEVNGSTPRVLGKFLSQANNEKFLNKNFNQKQPARVNCDVAPELMQNIARAASLGFVDFAGYVQSEFDDLNAEAENLRSQNLNLSQNNAYLCEELRRRDQKILYLKSTLWRQVIYKIKQAIRKFKS